MKPSAQALARKNSSGMSFTISRILWDASALWPDIMAA